MCEDLLRTLVVFTTLAQICVAQTPSRSTSRSIEIVEPAGIGLPDSFPAPKGRMTLFGGTVTRIDPIRDRILARAYGGRDVTIDFDGTTRVMRGVVPSSMRDVRPGDRIYVDTISKSGRTFAKTLRVETNSVLGDARGQIVTYDAGRGILRIRDLISSQPLSLRVTARTDIHAGDNSAQLADLVSGSLVKISFQGSPTGESVAEKIDILARPGSTFVFSGRIAVIDLRDSHLTLYREPDNNEFEVSLNSLSASQKLNLRQGTDVIVHAQFDGRKYEAQSVETISTVQPQK